MFDNRYAGATRWRKEGILVETRAYLDAMLLKTAVEWNVTGLFTYPSLRNEITPWVPLLKPDLK